MDFFRIICWAWLIFCAGIGMRERRPMSLFTLAGGTALGVGILANLLDNGYFEPIYTGWQYEHAGFCLILIFAGMMIWNNYLILKENEEMAGHLEELVLEKTSQLEAVLEERKNFFSDMAHGFKSPVTSIHGFINLIRAQNICIDEELSGYLDSIDKKNLEMGRRIQALNTLNAFDRVQGPLVRLSVTELLRTIAHDYRPEMDAAGIYFEVRLPGEDGFFLAQEEKISVLFENLIYNALHFTAQGGKITVEANILEAESTKADRAGEREYKAFFVVRDTGTGILPEDLPHIFERFYTVRKKPAEGSGLGLYIARLTVEELGGSIAAGSTPGKGTVFTITLPLVKE